MESWAKFVWACKKVDEADTRLDKVKAQCRSSLSRAKARAERRDGWFSWRIREFAKRLKEAGKFDTDCSVRVPEAGVRVELYERKPGIRVVDDDACVAAMIEHHGVFKCIELGLLEERYAVKKDTAIPHLTSLVKTTGLVLAGTTYDEEATIEAKIVSMRRGEEDSEEKGA